ncbi:uncharacterized protein LOC144104146 [Amblyomma americanum]
MAYRVEGQNGISMGTRAPLPPGGTPYEPPVDYYDCHQVVAAATTAAPAHGDGGGTWWQKTKRIYAQKWKKTDPVFPAQSAMLGLPMTAASLAGSLIGIGLVSAPYVFSRLGWSAILLLAIFAALATFSAILLKSCCEILESRFEEYRRFHWFTQYPDIAFRALGPACGKAVAILRCLYAVGIQAVVTVVTAHWFTDWFYGAVRYWLPDTQGTIFCGYITAFGLLMAIFNGPIGQQIRYWGNIGYLPFGLALLCLLLAGIAASSLNPMQSLGTSSVIDLGSLIRQIPSRSDIGDLTRAASGQTGGTSFFVALGVLAFIHGGVYGFTNIRRDMMTPADFTKAAACGIAGNALCCLVVGAVGYSKFGIFLNANVVLSLTTAANGIRLAAAFFVGICSGQLFSVVDVIQDEHHRAQDYGKRVAWSRVKINTPLSLLAALLALAVPYLGPLMALVGSLILCPVLFVLPPIFYYKLCQESPADHKTTINRNMKIALAVTVAVGALVTIGGTVSAIIEIVAQSRLAKDTCFSTFSYGVPFTLAPPPSLFLAALTAYLNIA